MVDLAGCLVLVQNRFVAGDEFRAQVFRNGFRAAALCEELECSARSDQQG